MHLLTDITVISLPLTFGLLLWVEITNIDTPSALLRILYAIAAPVSMVLLALYLFNHLPCGR